jgi:hypothetical protein
MSAKVQVMSPWVQTLLMVKPWEGSPGGDKSQDDSFQDSGSTRIAESSKAKSMNFESPVGVAGQCTVQ